MIDVRINTCYNLIAARGAIDIKYSELKKILRKNGCRCNHEGANHEIWYSPITNKMFPVARHNMKEVANGTLKAILKQAGIELKY